MATIINKKYADLKAKLDKISEKAPVLKGDGNMVELNPDNPHHREWFEKDKYKED